MQTLGIYAKQEYINSDLDDSAVCRERSAWVGRTSKAAEANGAHQSVGPSTECRPRARSSHRAPQKMQGKAEGKVLGERL